MDRKLERLYLRYARKGDSAALGRVFDLSCGELSGIARHLVPDAAAAEDVLQATYLTAIERADRYEPGRGVMPWLVGILARHAAQARRGAARKPDPERLTERAAEDPAKRSEDAELGALVAKELDALPETYAAALRPHLVDGRPAREIGRALGISAGAASVRVHRGLKMLRERLPRVAAPAALGIVVDRAGMREALVAAASDVAASAGGGAAAAAAPAAAAGGGASTATLPTTGLALAGGIAMKQSILMLGIGALVGAGATHIVESQLASRDGGAADGSPPAFTRSADDGGEESQLASAGAPGARGVAHVPPVEFEVAEEPLPEPAAPPANGWLAMLNSGDRGMQRDAIERILALAPDEGLEVVREVWGDVEEPLVRVMLVTSFVEAAHPHALDVLDLGVRDGALKVQNDALELAGRLSFREMEGDLAAYEAWRQEVAGLGLADALTASARTFAVALATLDDEALVARLTEFDDVPLEIGEKLGLDLTAILMGAGVADIVDRLLGIDGNDARFALRALARHLPIDDAIVAGLSGDLGSPDADTRARALDLLGLVELDEAYLRANVLPLLEARFRETPEAIGAAAALVGKPGNDWAVDPLLDALGERRIIDGASFDVARALAEIGEARAIPRMIAIINAHDGYETQYGVGYFGLRKLTGVPYDESHDGAFWTQWWESNRARFPEDVRGMTIPAVELVD